MPDGLQGADVVSAQLNMEMASALHEMRREPNLFIEHVLGVKLWKKQREIVTSVWNNPRTAVKSCHGSGKTYTAGQIVLAYLYLNPMARVVTTAPTFRQVVKLLWSEIKRSHHRAIVPLGGKLLNNELRLEEGWDAVGYTSDDPNAFQGVHSESGHVLAVLDEASGIDPIMWEAFEGILVGERTRLFSIGNPTDPTSRFATEFKAPGTTRFTISAFDTPNLMAGKTIIPGLIDLPWVEDKKTRWGVNSPAYQARVLGEFPDLSDDIVFQLRWIERAQARTDLRPMMFDKPRLGVDVARTGSDKSVLYIKHGPLLYKLAEYHGLSTMALVGRIKHAHDKYCFSNIRIDDIGVGGGVTDRCQEIGLPVTPINVGVAPRDRVRYANLKAEITYQLRDSLEHGHVQLNDGRVDENDRVINVDQDFLHQASSLKFKIRSEGKILIEPKIEFKKRIGVSPDDLDAAVLAWADVNDVHWVSPGGDDKKPFFAAPG